MPSHPMPAARSRAHSTRATPWCSSLPTGGSASSRPRCSPQAPEHPCPRQESNLDLPLRRRSSYPLDYEGVSIALRSTKRRLPALDGPGRRTARSLLGKPRQWLPDQAVRNPLVHRLRAEALVEAERQLVPLQRRPFQAPALLTGRRSDRRKQSPPDARAAVLRAHEDVLQPNPWPRQEARERWEVHGIAGGTRIGFANQRPHGRTLPE